MPGLLTPRSKTLHKAIIFALVFWSGGTACVFGCAQPSPFDFAINNDSSHHTSAQDDATEVVVLSASTDHACCLFGKDETKERFLEISSSLADTIDCCALSRSAFEAATLIRKPRIVDLSAVHSSARTWDSLQNPKVYRASRAFEDLRLPDASETYLRCCVFLI